MTLGERGMKRMEVEVIRQKLLDLDRVLDENKVDSEAYMDAVDARNALLFHDMTLREFYFIGKHMQRPITIDDEAKLIVAAHGNRLADEADIPASAKAALLIKRARHEKGMSQTELAGQVGLTQSQVAKIENVNIGIDVDLLQKILTVLGQSFVINAGRPAV
jgi:DNA-binding XRE family transcriptional regulator